MTRGLRFYSPSDLEWRQYQAHVRSMTALLLALYPINFFPSELVK